MRCARVNGPLQDRFDAKWIPEPNSGCWLWEGAGRDWMRHASHRRGVMGVNRRCVLAHRVSWELHRGPIPAGMMVCHRCDNPYCVNPDHLFLGTHQDNMRDMVTKGRRAGIPVPQRRGRGQWNAKLTDEAVKEIRHGGMFYRDAAVKFGVSTSVIFAIRANETWRHLP